MDGALNSLSTSQIQQWLHTGSGERLHLSSSFLPFLSNFCHAALRRVVNYLSLSSPGFCSFPLVWLALSWPVNSTLASSHLPASSLHTVTFELPLFPRDEGGNHRHGREAEKGENGKKLSRCFHLRVCKKLDRNSPVNPKSEANQGICAPDPTLSPRASWAHAEEPRAAWDASLNSLAHSQCHAWPVGSYMNKFQVLPGSYNNKLKIIQESVEKNWIRSKSLHIPVRRDSSERQKSEIFVPPAAFFKLLNDCFKYLRWQIGMKLLKRKKKRKISCVFLVELAQVSIRTIF